MKDDLQIDESKGEMLCDVCKGKGSLPYNTRSDITFQCVCWKCQGDGKVDWISHITGKPNKFRFYSKSGNVSVGTTSPSAKLIVTGNRSSVSIKNSKVSFHHNPAYSNIIIHSQHNITIPDISIFKKIKTYISKKLLNVLELLNIYGKKILKYNMEKSH